MFRRRPGRLLKVLYTFNLCPVSTGEVISVACFVEFSIHSSPKNVFTIIKKMCKTAFSAKFRAMKLKADACSLLLIFISINQ